MCKEEKTIMPGGPEEEALRQEKRLNAADIAETVIEVLGEVVEAIIDAVT